MQSHVCLNRYFYLEKTLGTVEFNIFHKTICTVNSHIKKNYENNQLNEQFISDFILNLSVVTIATIVLHQVISTNTSKYRPRHKYAGDTHLGNLVQFLSRQLSITLQQVQMCCYKELNIECVMHIGLLGALGAYR